MNDGDGAEAARELILPEGWEGVRLDRALAALLPEYSRGRLQQWMREGRVTVTGPEGGTGTARPRDPARAGARVVVRPAYEEETPLRPEPIALDVVHEDEALLVVNKPAGLVVHPGAGNPDGTVVNALLHHDPELAHLPRAGIVHRLDKETSGLMVVARSHTAHAALVRQLQARTVHRTYTALAAGTPTAGGRVEAPIGRHPRERKRMAVVESGRPAVTHYRVAERFPAHTLLDVFLETGRTHQIRVHLAHAGYPLVGDPVYGARARFPKGAGEELRRALSAFPRQALHARELALVYPGSGEEVRWSAPLPPDFEDLLAALRAG